MAGLVQYNGNNNRKPNDNVGSNREEKSFEISVQPGSSSNVLAWRSRSVSDKSRLSALLRSPRWGPMT